jgi:hypothetical protein
MAAPIKPKSLILSTFLMGCTAINYSIVLRRPFYQLPETPVLDSFYLIQQCKRSVTEILITLFSLKSALPDLARGFVEAAQ